MAAERQAELRPHPTADADAAAGGPERGGSEGGSASRGVERGGSESGPPDDDIPAPRAAGRAQAPEKTSWREVPERGSVLGMRFLVVLATTFGRAPARLFVRFVAFYFFLFAPRARNATRAFLRRVDAPHGVTAVYRQILRFAQCALDALFLLRGRTDAFRFERNGHRYLEKLRRDGQGAILLGAHLGSFYAMRARGEDEALPLYPLVYTRNAQRFNAVLESLDPSSRTRLVEMGEGGVGFMLRIRELVENGGLVAILGDRVPVSGASVEVDFLGGRIRLPTGPYLLAATLRCPVYFTVGLYRDPDLYELHCEPFADRVVLPRGRREEALVAYAQQYADRLAHFARQAPDNWFNFYEFWEKDA